MTRVEKVLCTAKAHTTGGRDGGASRTSDGRLDVKLSIPGTPGTPALIPNSYLRLDGRRACCRPSRSWPAK
jgi:organic hydroperoxide reductase OsmC/OhrA